MKYILLILLSIFTTIGLFACDDATGSITTVVDNNNGTYTVTIDVCMEFNGIEGSPYGIAFNFNNLNTTIVNSFAPASFSSLAGDLYPGIIRDGNTDALGDNVYGTNDGINNILQYYYTGSFPGNPGSNLLCNTFNITITGYPTSVDVVVNAGATSFGDCTAASAFELDMLLIARGTARHQSQYLSWVRDMGVQGKAYIHDRDVFVLRLLKLLELAEAERV